MRAPLRFCPLDVAGRPLPHGMLPPLDWRFGTPSEMGGLATGPTKGSRKVKAERMNTDTCSDVVGQRRKFGILCQARNAGRSASQRLRADSTDWRAVGSENLTRQKVAIV